MPLTMKCLGSGTLGTSSATLYTAPTAPAKGLVKEIILTNRSASAVSTTILFNGITIVPNISLAASGNKDAVLVLALASIITSGLSITGLASAATAIDYYISGLEG